MAPHFANDNWELFVNHGCNLDGPFPRCQGVSNSFQHETPMNETASVPNMPSTTFMTHDGFNHLIKSAASAASLMVRSANQHNHSVSVLDRACGQEIGRIRRLCGIETCDRRPWHRNSRFARYPDPVGCDAFASLELPVPRIVPEDNRSVA